MRLTRKLAGCEDKSCPAVWGTDQPGMVAVQGAKIPASERAVAEMPDHEDMVLIPADLLFGLASGQ
jgi:hypothetical protein